LFKHRRHPHHIFIRKPGQRTIPHSAGNSFDVLNCRLSTRREMNRLGPPIGPFPALDQAHRLEVIEKTDNRRAIKRQRFGEIFLTHRLRGAGDPQKWQPSGFGQTIGLKFSVDSTPPLPGGLSDQHSK
jgi:hypothetical protein